MTMTEQEFAPPLEALVSTNGGIMDVKNGTPQRLMITKMVRWWL